MPWKDNSLTAASGQYVASWRVATEPLVLSRSCGERNWKEKEAQEKDQRRTQNRSSLSSSSRTQTRLWISCSQWSQCSTVSNILKCHQMGGPEDSWRKDTTERLHRDSLWHLEGWQLNLMFFQDLAEKEIEKKKKHRKKTRGELGIGVHWAQAQELKLDCEFHAHNDHNVLLWANILKCHQMGGLKTAGARTQQNGCIGTVCGILKGGPLRSKTCHVQKRWFWISKIHRWLSQVTDCRPLSAQSSNSRSANCGNFFKPPQNTGGADARQSVVDLTSKITWGRFW